MAWIEDKRVVVTGATSGIGKEVATCLASLGAHVVLACRDARRATQVAAGINARTEARRATVMTVDTADQSSVRAFAAEFREAYGALDVLVNNAGVLLPSRMTSVDGVELTLATNVLGYHLVTTELLPALEAAAPSRIVNVASTFASDVELDDLQFRRRPYDGMAAYAQSKACDRMLTWALARRLRGRSVTVNAMAPGLMLGTRLYRDLPPAAVRTLQELGGRSVTDGAHTVVWLASSPELDGVSGKFFEQGNEIPCRFRDEASEEGLWQRCERLVGQLERQP
ncbi:MAG TPA: SDR family NAD(P)-dependent oxidoreductase [Acidimicrobiales bacterium]|nr:SDR family NAD(P)-dependent oxidoreductase [Acidimicrobiales bacterium]